MEIHNIQGFSHELIMILQDHLSIKNKFLYFKCSKSLNIPSSNFSQDLAKFLLITYDISLEVPDFVGIL